MNLETALVKLRPGSSWSLKTSAYEDVVWLDETTEKPSEEQVQAKIAELEAAEPMRLLREKRDRLIASTDWWVLPDRTPTEAQLQYRKALRDLPAHSPNAALDENGNLINVEWPEAP